MTIRTDIRVDFNVTPRLITIDAPSTEVSLQDLVDTLRDIEDQLPRAMAERRLIDAAGKEDLGGGTLVGITAELQDAQVYFESRTNLIESGTHTGPNGSSSLIDSAADFVTAGVTRGSRVLNRTDSSLSVVLTVVDLNTLDLIPPGPFSGSDNDFDNGDVYAVFAIDEVRIRGGNLVAVDALGSAIVPTVPGFGVSMTRELSTSAALVLGSLTAIQDARLILVEQILRNRLETDPVTGIMTLYDDAGVPLLTAQLSEDVAELQTYRGQGAERRNRLT